MKNEEQRASLCVLGTALGYSLMGLVLKGIPWPPLVISGMEKGICFLVLGLSRGSFRIRFSWKMLFGGAVVYASSTLFILANQLTTAANAVVLQYTNPIFVLAFSVFFLHKRAGRKDLVMLLMMILGILLFFLEDLSPGSMAGNAVAILSGLCMAAGTLFAHYSHLDVREYSMITCLLAMGIGLFDAVLNPPALSLRPLLLCILYGVFCTGLPIVLFAKGAPRVEPVKISMLLMAEPVLGPVWVALATGEIPGPMALCGAVVVILCLVLNLLPEERLFGSGEIKGRRISGI